MYSKINSSHLKKIIYLYVILILLFANTVNAEIKQQTALTHNGMGLSVLDQKIIEPVIEMYLKDASVDLTKPVLDIGCGFGRTSIYLADKGAKEVYSIDKCRKNIKRFISDYNIDEYPQINPIVSDISKYDSLDKLTKSKKISSSILINVVHFWMPDEIEKNFSNIYSVLDDKGSLLVVIENEFMDKEGMQELLKTVTEKEKQIKQWEDEIERGIACFDYDALNSFKNRVYSKLLNNVFNQILAKPNSTLLDINTTYDISKRQPLYPFVVANVSPHDGKGVYRHYLFPHTLSKILRDIGFSKIDIKQINPESYAYIVYK